MSGEPRAATGAKALPGGAAGPSAAGPEAHAAGVRLGDVLPDGAGLLDARGARPPAAGAQRGADPVGADPRDVVALGADPRGLDRFVAGPPVAYLDGVGPDDADPHGLGPFVAGAPGADLDAVGPNDADPRGLDPFVAGPPVAVPDGGGPDHADPRGPDRRDADRPGARRVDVDRVASGSFTVPDGPVGVGDPTGRSWRGGTSDAGPARGASVARDLNTGTDVQVASVTPDVVPASSSARADAAADPGRTLARAPAAPGAEVGSRRRSLILWGLPGASPDDPQDVTLTEDAVAWVARADLGDRSAVPAPFTLRTCGERLEPAAAFTRTHELARLALDVAPDVGDQAPAWMFGPWADALDSGRPAHRRLWAAAVGAAAFTLAPEPGRSPFRSWCRDDPRPTEAERAAVVAVHRAPFAPWRLVEPLDNRRWRLAATLPLGAGVCPLGPVDLAELGWWDTPPEAGAVIMARVLPAGDGWYAVTPILLPTTPSMTQLRGWLARVAWPMLQENDELRLEDVLRRAGHHLVALAHRAAVA